MLQFLSSYKQPCCSSRVPFNLAALKDTQEIMSFPHCAHTPEWWQEPTQLLHHKTQVAFTVIVAPLRFWHCTSGHIWCPSASLEPGPSSPPSRSSTPPYTFSPVSPQGHLMFSAEKVSGCELSLHVYCLQLSGELNHRILIVKPLRKHTFMTVLAIHAQKP